MFERVHRVVAHGCVVEVREMPHVQVHRPQRQRDQRIGEEAQVVEESERRPQDRPGQAREKCKWREISQQDVLQHVKAEELLAERVHRADERDQEDRDSGREEGDPPDGNRYPPGAPCPHAAGIEDCQHSGRHDLQRVESPAGVDGQMGEHGSSLPSCSSSITTW